MTELSFSEETQLPMNIYEPRQLASCLFAFLNELETPESIMSDTHGESTQSKEPANLHAFWQRGSASMSALNTDIDVNRTDSTKTALLLVVCL